MGLEIADAGTLGELKGDVPGLGRLVVTDTESGGKDRWTVIVGGQSRYVSDDPTALLLRGGGLHGAGDVDEDGGGDGRLGVG
jgi:hypothetical protein